jgi:myo-inositol-1(or 4)-monophosphatase
MANAALKASRALLRDFGEVEQLQVSIKGPGEFVSTADLKAERTLRNELSRARPGYGLLFEEGGETAGSDPHHRWIVDPLDGTTNFLYGFPAWSVSVAAAVDGKVRVGAVFDPTHDELWTAAAGAGAACNGVALAPLVDCDDLATALVSTGFAYQAHRRAIQGAVVAALLPQVRDVRRAGSAALDLCWLAAGRVDAYFESGTHIWDWAAGSLIASEAGAWVGGFDGGAPSADGLLAAKPGLAGPLRALLATAASSRT